MKKTLLLSLLLNTSLSLLAQDQAEHVFTDIYNRNEWLKGSGEGSTVENTVQYRHFLQNFLREKNITSVVEAGCGDWQFSKLIDWEGVNYVGFDVVKSVIAFNQENYQKPNISFVHLNAIHADLPEADLLICKDVLQHLPIADIQRFITQFPKFKYCLITNDVDFHTRTAKNSDIPVGHYRHLDLTKSPFHVKGRKIFEYVIPTSYGPDVKQVLLIERGR